MSLTLKQQRGQFFTVNNRVQEIMSSLLTNATTGAILEPSAGAGDLAARVIADFPDSTVEAWELDTSIISHPGVALTHGDFFALSQGREGAFVSIIGNPPYVGWKSVEEATRMSAANVKHAYSDKTNLYHLFLDRCIDLLEDNGEMVMIVPKEWLYATSAKPLRQKILQQGSITHIIDGGEEKVFPDADIPAIMIFRFVKGQPQGVLQHRQGFAGDTYESKVLEDTGGRWLFLSPSLKHLVQDWGRFGDNFQVRVGIVSGADNVFRAPWEGYDVEDKVRRTYLTTKGLEEFLDASDLTEKEIPAQALAFLSAHKDKLMARRIAKFDETNWWKYGAIRNKGHMESDSERFYTFAKTRSARPFFVEDDAQYYGGGILGIFIKDNSGFHKESVVELLNHPNFFQIFEALLITTHNKVSFQPSTLEDMPFPRNSTQLDEALATFSII